jgi:HAD superfamily hydrolase (TIGR01509 family)
VIYKPKFIYFDFDDTLIDVGSLHAAAFKLTIDATDLELDLNYRLIAGLDTEGAFQALGFGKSESEKLAKVKRKHFGDLAKNSEPMWVEGIPNLLDSLDKEGIRYGVVSSGAGHRIRETLIELDSLSRFMFIISREDVKQPKPHPDPFLQAISKSNASIVDSLVVEDSLNGYLSATSAGLEVWQLIVNSGEDIFAAKNGSAKELEKWIIGAC